jgi:predicted  nucleic acid-binding Zn-ribbon protein
MDTQSRLDALKLQKEKLTEMVAEATDVEELIAIDDKLTEVIAQMESLEGDLRRWESEQSYSKVTLRLAEVFEEIGRQVGNINSAIKGEVDNDLVEIIDKMVVYPVLKLTLCGRIF